MEIFMNRISDFTSPRRKSTTKSNAKAVTFYKLLMSLSNLHSTVYSMYVSTGHASQGQFHRDLSAKFANEANRVKNIAIVESEDENDSD